MLKRRKVALILLTVMFFNLFIVDGKSVSAISVQDIDIVSTTNLSIGDAKKWAKDNGATETFIGLSDLYWKYSKSCGNVNPALAYVQAALETGYGHFGGVLNESYKNPCGMKTSSGGGDYDINAHKKFNSWDEGVQAQLDHLALYAGASGYPKKNTYDPRHFSYLLGTAKTALSLTNKWAGDNYGDKLLKLYNSLLSYENSMNTSKIVYKSNIQDIGWEDWISEGIMSGTSDQSRRIESIQIKLQNQEYQGSIDYRTYIQDIGWQNWVSNSNTSGTIGQSKRLEAIEIKLTGEMSERYDIYYRVHAQDYGWLGWAKNGEPSGTKELSKRLEAIEIKLVNKGDNAPGSTDGAFIEKEKILEVRYQTHVQDIGWQNFVSNGEMSGTSGQAKRLEGIRIQLENQDYSGSISYRTHVQDIGWQDFVSNGEMSGTSGQAKRLEAIQIKLTDEMEKKYDIYYRVHAQDYGWLGWAKNGESAGTEGLSKRLEAIEIKLVNKGSNAPGSTDNAFVLGRKTIVVDPGHNYGGDGGAIGYIDGIPYYERDLNMKVSLYLKEYLENYGYRVILTRQESDREKLDEKPSLEKRIKIANDAKADLFISIHHNSFESPLANGCEVYYYKDNNADKVSKSKKLATDSVNNISKSIGFNNRGAKEGNYIKVLKDTTMPGILVEGGFMSNPNELSSLIKDSIQRKIAKSIADAVKIQF